jgi:putative SOS response-associated peptidase YedK
MCGRFTIISDPVTYQLEFDIKIDNNTKHVWKRRYNVSPSQSIPVVHNAPRHDLHLMRWGLIPNWSSNRSGKINLINVRAETIREKIYFRKLVEQGKRCLILANGFYEWQSPAHKGMPKTPYYFQLKDGKPFVFAGVWEESRTENAQTAQTCAIITCPPNALVSSVHNRMPVMLNASGGREWLAQNSTRQLLSLLKPYPADAMQAYPVSRMVNSPQTDEPACILPLES